MKKLVKAAAMAVPLVIGTISPASACLLTGASDTAAQKSPQIEQGPFGTGPTAPVPGLQNADAHNPQDTCEGMMCDPSGKHSG